MNTPVLSWIRCVNVGDLGGSCAPADHLTVGDLYMVKDQTPTMVYVMNDQGDHKWFSKNRFEQAAGLPVETPAPTEETAGTSGRFKVGDSIRCISALNVRDRLSKGKVYQVSGVSADNEFVTITDDERVGEWYQYRFELVKPEKQNDAPVANSEAAKSGSDALDEMMVKLEAIPEPVPADVVVPSPSIYEKIANQIGTLVTERNKTYGNSFAKTADFLKLLWPEGVPVEAYGDMTLLCRIFDKIMRISQGQYTDSYADICGYGVLGTSVHESDDRV